MSNTALVSSILNNRAKHVINREEKMEETLDVMCGNMEKKIWQAANHVAVEAKEHNRWYGEGRKSGD